jgi:signal transduction histidine kinase
VVGFLDCSRELDSLSLFYYSSIGFAFLMVVVLLIIIAFLSRRAMQPYVDNMESQREFITNAGHELKTPFAIISANTEVLEMLNGKNEWTESILSQVARGTSLINDLITLSRTTEAAEIVLTDVDLSEVTAQSAQSFRTVIEQQGKHLECGIEEQVTVKGEQKLLTELVNILVDNAAKYCDENGTVRVVLKKRGRSGAQLMVSNDFRDGSQEECSHYFQRFYRGDTSHNSGKSGYGIGLSMAQTIAEKLKGSITADWKEGVITFTVLL